MLRAHGGVRRAWPLLVVGGFALAYAGALTFVYGEGDDMVSIAYHVLGRDPAIAAPFSVYHALMDVVLGWLPPHEPLLRTTAIALTSVAGPLVLLAMLALAQDQLGEAAPHPWAAAAVALLAMPEMIYLSLVYQPATIGFAWVLGAHLLLRRGLRRATTPRAQAAYGALAVAGFAVGAAARWDLVVYGLVIVVDLCAAPGALGRAWPGWRGRVTFAVVWGAAALGGWFALLALIGYPPAAIFGLNTLIRDWIGQGTGAFILRSQPLFTPAFVVLGVAGAVVLVRRRSGILLPVLAGVLVTAIWLPRGMPKFFLAAIPGMLTVVLAGLGAATLRYRRGAVGVGLGALLALPWVLGVQVASPTTDVGPGFTTSDTPPPAAFVRVVPFGGGVAIPTYEGPRPLWGHARVLFGGGWRRYLRHNDQLAAAAGRVAAEQGLSLLTQPGRDVVTMRLLQYGWTPVAPTWTEPFPTSAYGVRALAYRPADPAQPRRHVYEIYHDDLFNAAFMADVAAWMPEDRVVVVLATGTDAQQMRALRPSLDMTVVNSRTVIVNLADFACALAALP